MILDRKMPPKFQEIKEVKVLEANITNLQNGMEVAYINAGTEKVVKLDLVFNAGTAAIENSIIAHAANNLLDKGTPNKTAHEIATAFDNIGAYINSEISYDRANLTLYTLTENIAEALDLLIEVLTEATFPEKEFKNYLNNEKQKLRVNLEKVAFVAKQEFNALIFGKDHPYATKVKLEDFVKVDLADVKSFYQNHILNDKMRIQIAGDVGEDILASLERHFGSLKLKSVNETEFPTEIIYKASKVLIEKKTAVQSAIRIGKPLFNRTHPDYVKMQMLSTILGGYFGSRLMANIREDKGYTYGIGSALVPLKNAAYFFITTEVGAEVCKAALSEIYKEIIKLQTEPISEQELKLVKNYVLGSFLKSVDGPFAQMDKYQILKDSDLDYNYFNRYVQNVKSLTTDDIQVLANKYLQVDSLTELVVGKVY